MAWSAQITGGLLWLASVGCSDVVTVPNGPPPPAIEGLLLADSLASTFRIFWPSDAAGHPPTPVSADSIALSLGGPTGRAVLVPIQGSAGAFRVSLPIRPGAVYRLTGTVAGRSIRAETTVPRSFVLHAPSDSVEIVVGHRTTTRFHWHAEGAAGFFARGARLSPLVAADTRDTVGTIFFDPIPGTDRTTYTLFAVDEAAQDYLFLLPSAKSNVEGGFGYLGSAIAASRVVHWR